jgi:glycosyltransferase involved in cell wall biosynthesis
VIVGRGDPRLAVYTEALHARTARLGLGEAVVFTGGVSLAALRAYYQAAHLFVITSRHEGFCVPLVEAMALGVPVLALGSTAVPGTVGDAGLVWQEDDPQLLAESMHRLVTDREAAAVLGARGCRRYHDHFTNARIEHRFLAALGRLCGTGRI